MVCKITPKNSKGTQCRADSGGLENTETADYETALDLAGYGSFSRSVLGACACAFFTTGVQNCLMSYVLPAAKCELQLTTYQAGLINMSFMFGGVASAFFWGIIADVFGRRRVLSTTLIVDSLLTLLQSSVNDYRILVVMRCINGFLIGGPSTLVFSYLSDLVGVRKRQLYLNVTGMSFVVAWLILPAVAWLIIPYKPSQYLPTLLPIYSWRLFLAISSIPGFISGIWVLFLPESPRLLADTNRTEKAVKILTRIFEANARKNDQEFKIKTITLPHVVIEKKDPEDNKTKRLFLAVMKDLKIFVSRAYAWKSSLILFVFFANMAAGFGLNLWIPELLLRIQGRDCKLSDNSNTTNGLYFNNKTEHVILHQISNMYEYQGRHQINELNNSAIEKYIHKFDKDSCDQDIDEEIYTSGLIVGAACVLGNAICAIISARGGAKGVRISAAGCALVCALACCSLAACVCSCTSASKLAVAAAAALNAASLNGNVLLIRLLLHAVPPKLSALAVCWGAWWGRAGGVASNLAVGVLLDLSCPSPFIAVAIFLGVSVIAVMLIKLDPNETTKPRDDVLEDIEPEDKTMSLDRYITTHM